MRFAATFLCFALLAGCAGADDEESTPDAPAPAPGQAPVQAPVTSWTLEDFRKLHWLDGRWKGTMSNGTAFYESYSLVNDSTIQMYGHPDEAFGAPTDSARITLRGGRISSEGATSRYEASVAGDSVVFQPVRGASNGFSWRSTGPDTWTATVGLGGQTTTYPMERVK